MAASSDQPGRRVNGTVQAWGNKTEHAQKIEVMKEIRKLQVQIQAMEREKTTHIYSKRSDFRPDYIQLEEMESKITEDIQSEKAKLQQQLEKISHAVKRFQKELKDVKPTPEFVEKLKVIMEDIEGTINSFKEQQRHKYEELLLEERTATQEIEALEKRFEAWNHQTEMPTSRSTNPSKPLASARDVTKDLPPEVAAFEKFLSQTGGHRGGWDEYDHGTFLKFRNRYKGKPVFVGHLVPALPTKTKEEIEEHDNWYQEYLFLNEVKKDKIKKWKEERAIEKEEVATKANEDDTKEDEEDKQSAIQAKIEEERRERFAGLNAWRVQKELEKAQAEERKMREEMMQKKKQEEDRKRQEEVKAMVLVHKQQREQEEEFLRLEQEHRELEEQEQKRRAALRGIAKFRQRDQRTVAERLAKDQARREEEREKELRLERLKSQVEVSVPSDPNRLLQPTKGWKERLKDPGPVNTGPLLHMPHRAVPSWRQGLH